MASTLQVLYAIDPDAVAELTTSSDLKDQMNALAPTLGTTVENGASRYLMLHNVLKKYGYRVLYNKSDEAVNSIDNGYPCIAHIKDAKRFPRYVSKGYATGTGHYITVIGYDSVSDMLLFSDCSYLINPNTGNTNFGIYLVACDDLDQLALESTDVINVYVAAP